MPEELGNRLRSVTSVLQEGIGFTVLRGLNPQDYYAKDSIIVYAGILSYIGDQRITNAFGMSIGKPRAMTPGKTNTYLLGRAYTRCF